jgi:hypothetical protein
MQFKLVFAMTDSGDRRGKGFGALIELLSPAIGSLQNHDDWLLQKIWVTAKEFMLLNARQFCEMAGTRPVLQVYGSDMTPMLLNFKMSLNAGQVKEARVGRISCEWLLHAGYFITTDSFGDYICRKVFEAPVLMASKKTWYSYACAARMSPLLKSWHPQGISISWYVFDR